MDPCYERYMQEEFPAVGARPAGPFYAVYSWKDEKERDQRRLQELYPALARQIQPLVEEECDRLEYDGSFMFDEYPDRLVVRRLCGRIYDKMDKSRLWEDGLAAQSVDSRQEWAKELIAVLLLNEMHGRRCRRRERRTLQTVSYF